MGNDLLAMNSTGFVRNTKGGNGLMVQRNSAYGVEEPGVRLPPGTKRCGILDCEVLYDADDAESHPVTGRISKDFQCCRGCAAAIRQALKETNAASR